MVAKLRLLKTELKEKGLWCALKRIMLFLIRPITSLIRQNRFLTEMRYGILPRLSSLIPFYSPSSGLVRFPQSELVERVRRFWYLNETGIFDLEGEAVSRKDIFTYGGPNPKFTCPICQKAEWLSRLRQKNLFVPHSCPQSEECKILCSHQGDELWTHLHQNFDFSLNCQADLPAPKCLYLIHKGKEDFLNPYCELWLLVTRRRLAYTCQIDVVDRAVNIDWSKYDFVFLINGGNNPKFTRPNIPIIMYGHDFWPLGDKGFQWVIDWVEPDVFLTTDPTPWQENFKITSQTKMAFYPFFDSMFFARPNLSKKKKDLLVIGAVTSTDLYQPRILLDKQISQLGGRYKVEFSHLAGSGNVFYKRNVLREDSRTGRPLRLLNKWSEYLGEAKYVIFGRMKYPCMVSKYCETLGSGAIPIFPEIADLKYLKIKPFEHYIPLSEVEGDNDRLAYYLENYEKFRYIAENAVKWYKENSDRMIFNDFENLVGQITNHKYPKRLI